MKAHIPVEKAVKEHKIALAVLERERKIAEWKEQQKENRI